MGQSGGCPTAGNRKRDFTAETLKNSSGFEDSTFTLVAGDGDTDNSKFTINSSGQLVTTSYNFKQGASGKSYSIRVKAVGKRIEVRINDEAQPLIAITDDHYTAPGQVGVRMYTVDNDHAAASFDNVRVTPLPTNASSR